jgi:heparan-alpha-glucosaminide N-acetyltransferase
MTAYAAEWPVQIILVVIYLAISLGAQAPGCPRGFQGPGGLGNDSKDWDCTGGIHRYIDMKFFGYNHIYHYPTCQDLYDCVGYDPEGLLGVITACTLTYLGLMTGRVLLHFKGHQERITRWLIWAAVQLFLAGCLCGFSQFEGPIPVNKNLWTTSFALLTSGLGLVGLSFCYVTIDIKRYWTGAPFIYLGMNSILMYVGSEVLFQFPFTYEIYTNPTHSNLLLMNVVGTVSWVVVAFYCYKIKFFVKI